MPEHVLIPCKQCQRGLRVRVKYLGQSVGCNHCGHHFVAKLSPAAAESIAVATTVRYTRIDQAETPNALLASEPEFQRLDEERVRLKAENDYLSSRLATMNYQRLSLQLRTEDLESQLNRAHEHVQIIEVELASFEAARSERDRLRIEAFALREKALHTLRLEDELQTLRAHVEEQRTEFEQKLGDALRERDEAVRELDLTKRQLTEARCKLERL